MSNKHDEQTIQPTTDSIDETHLDTSLAKFNHPTPHAFTGILLAIAGMFLFACMDSTTKYLSTHYQVPFVVAIRYITHFFLMLMIVAPLHAKKMLHTQQTGLVIVRGVALTLASILMGFALHLLPVAEASAISFLAPPLVVVIAGYFLKEEVGFVGWLAIVLGIAGVLLIARPSSNLNPIGVVLALLVVVFNTIYQLLSRVLAHTERALALLFYTALVGAICFGMTLPWYWENKTPSMTEYGLFLFLGVSGGLGHYCFTLAYKYASASVISSMIYSQLVWAGLLGWIVFDHSPDMLAICGMIIIVAAGLLVAWKAKLNHLKID